MKKAFLALVLLLAATASSFADSQPTRRYIVTMRDHGIRPIVAHRSDEPATVILDELEHLDTFIIDATDAQAQRLRRVRGVRAVEPDREVHLLTSAPVASNAVIAQKTPYGIDLVRAPQVWPYATGAAIKVAVIDTGIDHTHPDLRVAYRGGKDFVNNDDDPMDDNGHGTHVAGIIAAANDATGVVGVAPGVELYGLKVLGAGGSGSLSNILKALNWAIQNGMNIVNLSLGSQEFSTAEEDGFNKLRDAGVLAVAASGNCYDSCSDFPEGVKNAVSFPAGYSSVLAIGAIDRTSTIASFSQRGTGIGVVAPGVAVLSDVPVGSNRIAQVETAAGSFDALPMELSPEQNVTGQIVFSGFGQPSDFPAAVSGNIALIQRSLTTQPESQRLTFARKVLNARAAGAKAVIIFNREEGPFGGTLVDPSTPLPAGAEWLPTVSISLEDGLQLKNVSGEVTLRFGISNDYAELDGTSMATPHAAGVAALIWSLRPTATAAEVREALMSTAFDLGDPGFDSTFGAGRIDALDAGRRLSPSSFNPPEHGPRRRPVRR